MSSIVAPAFSRSRNFGASSFNSASDMAAICGSSTLTRASIEPGMTVCGRKRNRPAIDPADASPPLAPDGKKEDAAWVLFSGGGNFANLLPGRIRRSNLESDQPLQFRLVAAKVRLDRFDEFRDSADGHDVIEDVGHDAKRLTRPRAVDD